MERYHFTPREPEASSEKGDSEPNPTKRKEKNHEAKPWEREPKSAAAGDQKNTSETARLWQRSAGELLLKPKSETEAEDKSENPKKSEEAEVEQVDASEAPLDHLSEAEQAEVAEAYLAARQQEVASELAAIEPGSTEAEEAAAASKFLETTKSELDAAEKPDVYAATEHAQAKTLHDYGAEETSEAAEPHDSAPSGFVELGPAKEPIAETAASTTRPEDFMRYMGDVEQVSPDRIPPDFIEPPTGSSRGGFGEPPRWTSYNRFQPDDLNPPAPPLRTAGVPVANVLNQYPDNASAERRAAAGGLLVGGIVGYLIGRRRGRIKTEKRLIPIQKKLEHEVRALQTHIAEKEMQVRKLVREQIEKPAVAAQWPAHEAAQRVAETHEAKEVPPTPVKKPSEHLGLTTLKAIEARPVETVKVPTPSVEAMDRDTLLEAGEKITVGATSLRRVYETNLISERGLRRAVSEARRGGDVSKVLAEEMLIKEMSYERDPVLRDRQLREQSQSGSASGSQSAAQTQVAQQMDEAARIEASAQPRQSKLPKSTQQTIRPVLIAANAVAVVILAILLIVLFIVRV